MAAPIVRQLESIADLRRASADWNKLWQRSAAARPTSRAEQLAIWHDCFAGGRPFRALVVGRGGQFVAALPFVTSRRWGMPLAGSLGNAWSPGGELLLDPTCDAASVCAELVQGLRRYMPGLLSLDGLLYESEPNRALLTEFETKGIAHVLRRRFTAPLLHINGSWSAYLASRSRNVRRQLRTIAGRADELGGIEFQRCDHLPLGEVEPLLRACFQLEAAGWKGRESSAVLSNPLACQFFWRQAEELARCGQLAIALLRRGERIVAFEYGWQSNGVRGVLKIGYDESLARLSPGQLLRMRLLEQLFSETQTQWVDFLGPTTRATGQWATHRYEVGRTSAAVGSRIASAALAGYRILGQLRGHAGLNLSSTAVVNGAAQAPLPCHESELGTPAFSHAASDLDNPAGENLECNVHAGVPGPRDGR